MGQSNPSGLCDMSAKCLLTDLSSDSSIEDGSISRNRRPRLWVPTEPGPRSTPHVLVTRSQVSEAELPLTTSVCCCLGVTSARLRLAGELHQRVCNLWSAGVCPGKMLVGSMNMYTVTGVPIYAWDELSLKVSRSPLDRHNTAC